MKISLLHGDDENVANFVMRRLGVRAAQPYWAIGIIPRDGGPLLGGVVLNGWNGANVDVTIYAPGLVSRSLIRAIFAYVFEGLKASRITARTQRQNIVARDMLRRLGFARECIAREYYGSGRQGDAFVYRMMARNCYWIGK